MARRLSFQLLKARGVEHGEGVGLGVEDVALEEVDAVVRDRLLQQEVVLERLREEEGLHAVVWPPRRRVHVREAAVRDVRAAVLLQRVEHAPPPHPGRHERPDKRERKKKKREQRNTTDT